MNLLHPTNKFLQAKSANVHRVRARLNQVGAQVKLCIKICSYLIHLGVIPKNISLLVLFATPGSIDAVNVPARYRRRPIDEAEIECILVSKKLESSF